MKKQDLAGRRGGGVSPGRWGVTGASVMRSLKVALQKPHRCSWAGSGLAFAIAACCVPPCASGWDENFVFFTADLGEESAEAKGRHNIHFELDIAMSHSEWKFSVPRPSSSFP